MKTQSEWDAAFEREMKEEDRRQARQFWSVLIGTALGIALIVLTVYYFIHN